MKAGRERSLDPTITILPEESAVCHAFG